MAEAFLAQCLERAPQVIDLPPNDMGAEFPVATVRVAVVAKPLRQVEDGGDWQHIMGLGQRHQRLPRLRLDVRRVNHRQLPRFQPFAGNKIQSLERIRRSCLVVFIIADESAAKVRRENLRCGEVLTRKGALARPGGADKDDEAQGWDGNLHGVSDGGVAT